jgi:hypothetical protein
MYTGTLIEGLLDIADRVATAARVGEPRNIGSTPQSESAFGVEDSGARLESEELAQPFGLSAADRDLSLLLVVHSQLVRALEPGHDFPDTVDVH